MTRSAASITMVTLGFAAWACWAQDARPAAPASAAAEVLAAATCLARPGDVPAPVVASDGGPVIAGWSTAASATEQPGTFVLTLRQGARAGSVVIYGAGEVSVFVGTQVCPVGAGAEAGRGLRVIPLPPGPAVEAVKIVAPARLTRDTLTKGPTYQATLPWLTLLPQRAVNVAAAAGVHVSSADEPSKCFQPQPWLNRPDTLVDGFIDERRNFFTAKREADITADKPEWVMLHWDAPRLHNPGLRVEYRFSYLPYPLASVPWQTPSGKGGCPDFERLEMEGQGAWRRSSRS